MKMSLPAENIFNAKKKDLECIEGIGSVKADSIKKFDNFKAVEEELQFIEKHHLQALFLTDIAYPTRLLT